MSKLAAKRIVITGASSGVGAATTRMAAEQGAQLALLARESSGLRRVAAAARRAGAVAHAIPVDLADRAAAQEAVEEAADRLGGIDVLVSNAAVAPYGRFEEMDPEAFERVVDVTFGGAVAAVRAALPHLERSAGVVVATGSAMARVPLPGFSSYAASKHALRGFLGSLRIELQSSGSPVRIAMVHPGPVNTPLWAGVTSDTGRLPRMPPDSYTAETVARAVLASAVRPRAEITVGAQTRALELLFAGVRPLGDLLLLFIDRWYRNGDGPSSQPGSLWESNGSGEESGGLRSRTSLAMPARLGLGAPDLRAPLGLARNLVAGAPTAARVARDLVVSPPVRLRP